MRYVSRAGTSRNVRKRTKSGETGVLRVRISTIGEFGCEGLSRVWRRESGVRFGLLLVGGMLGGD